MRPGDLSSVDLAVVDANDALTDTPIPSFYRDLDARYPGSKFILTVRDSEGWLKSCKKQFTQRFAEVQTEAHKQLFLDLYGTDVFDEDRFARGYEAFVDGVAEYFKDRPHDLLTIDVTAGEGWEKLCPFLERPVPDIPFPKANVTQVRWMSVDDIVAVAVRAGQELLWRYDGERPTGLVDNNSKSGGSRVVKQLVARAVHTVLGEDGGSAAARAAHKVIVKGLTKLNPQIPVLSRVGQPVAYNDRKDWNHLWLVDPLDGEAAFARGLDDFSVNIALIEDGRPIYGVVHAPATGTTYYASTAKGAYRRLLDAEPVRLMPGGGSSAITATRSALDASTGNGSGASRALAICSLADQTQRNALMVPASMEWHTAAAQAIVGSVGLRLLGRESTRELMYNKKDFSNGDVEVS